ncbi:MAG: sulfatase-like hydrolase/transferase [Rhodospirillaceae bacterium]
MQPKNLVILMSDQHTQKVTGCYGHPFVSTPNLDALARRGTRFDAAYTPCPVCVPARAAFATGKYVHQIGYWDNATPFHGEVPSWHSLLRDRGHQTVSIGKLHFRSDEDDNGFSDEQIAMHVIEGKGDLLGLVRDEDMPKRGASWKMAKMAGPGESMYTRYDRDITARAQSWLYEEAPKYDDKPWVLFVSLVAPHFPLTAPSEHFYRYFNMDLPAPKLYELRNTPIHPYVDTYRKTFAYDEFFTTPDQLKRGQAGYLGLVSFMDEQVGKIMGALEKTGRIDDTRVVYFTDHGDNLGNRGCWGKSVMYEEAACIPMIVAGPDIPEGAVCDTPSTLLDIYPFIMDCVGARDEVTVPDEVPATSLADLIAGADKDRVAFSEYHAMGSATGAFMVRRGTDKLIYYVDYPPQFFDLANDPEELNDLGSDPAMKPRIDALVAELLAICDPKAVDAQAKRDQGAMLAENGGKEAVIKRGDLGFSVPPGVQPMFD